MNNLLRSRIWTSFPASSGVGPCDVPFRYASASIFDFGSRISDFLQQLVTQNLIVQISPFVLWFSRAFLLIFNPNSAFRIPQSSTRWHAHLRGLATAIHEISGLKWLAALSSFLSPELPSKIFPRTINLTISLAAHG